MSIENSLERIATALETLAGNAPKPDAKPAKPETAAAKKKRLAAEKTSSSKGAEKTKDTSTAPAASDKESDTTSDSQEATTSADGADGESSDVTLADVKKALVTLQTTVDDAAPSIKILKEVGKATTIGKLKPENYAAIIEACEEAMPA